MNCLICSSPTEAKPHGDVSLYCCANMECSWQFFDPQDVHKILPPQAPRNSENILLAVRNLALDPFARHFKPFWENFSDEMLAELVTLPLLNLCLEREAQNLLGFDLFIEIEDRHGVEVADYLQDLFTDLVKDLLGISMAMVIAQRTRNAQSPAANKLAELLKRDEEMKDLTLVEANELARLSQFKFRPNPDCGGDKKEQQEENNQIVLEALLNKLNCDPLSNEFTKNYILSLMQGALNKYPVHADNVLAAKLQTSRRRAIRVQSLEESQELPFPVEVLSDSIQEILLDEILIKPEQYVMGLKSRGYTQKEIAQMMSISQPHVSQILRMARFKISMQRHQA